MAAGVSVDFAKPVAPDQQDKRWRIVDATMRRLGHHPRGLIETLHTVQEAFGYLDEGALRYVANSLHVPLSRAFGVATFYHFFTLKPAGKHTCVVCMGTACYIKGAPQLLSALEKDYGIEPGETTPDGKVSLLTARCLGSCGLAPAVVYDRDVAGKVTPQDLRERVVKWMSHDA
jgi:bidirectional [NiFe] hydrogenase diaphorase subunit